MIKRHTLTSVRQRRMSESTIARTRSLGYDDAVQDPTQLSELTARSRKRLKTGQFAIPESKKYPIHDEAHARNALARVSQHGTPEEKRRVRSAVARKFPGIKVQKKKGGK